MQIYRAGTPLASRPCRACFGCAPRVPCQQPPHSWGPPCALLAPLLIHESRPPFARPRMSTLSLHATLSTRQDAYSFNQPLSFDTSSVTTMNYMFAVRSARALPQQPPQLGPPCALLALLLTHDLPSPGPTCRPSLYAALSTRQSAYAFNQPLSLNTSSVTIMSGMFGVRSARALPQQPPQLGPPCALAVPPPPHALSSRPAPLFMLPFRHSAERGGVQSAAELRHVQRHSHGVHVQRALLPVPCQ